jgi:uncharacterized protein YcbX
MAMNPHLARICIFPVKSLDGLDLSEAVVLSSGALAHDREYCLLDRGGKILNGKRLGEAILKIRSEVHLGFGEIRLGDGSETVTYRFDRDKSKIESWLSQRLGESVRLAQDTVMGFPDDTDSPGPTIISTATLREVGGWFQLDVEEARSRFRANLEIDGVEPFWEDCLYSDADETVRFSIGDVEIEGVNPCARCAVPSRDSRTGAIAESAFQKIFAARRQDTLPPWANARRFDHFYRLAVNTRIPASEAGKTLHVMDEVEV